MKNAFLKDTIRSVRRSLSRFLSIVGIVLLGSGIFAGLAAVSPDMQNTGDKYYDDSNVMDISLLSTYGFTEDDVKAIKNTEGVLHVMPSYSVDTVSRIKEKDFTFRVHALPENNGIQSEDCINRPILSEGRWPQNPGECVLVAKQLNIEENIQIGDTIVLQDANGLKYNNYKIVGFVKTPYYISFMLGVTNKGNGRLDYAMYVPNSDFSMAAYTELFVTVKDAKSFNTFSDKYETCVSSVEENLKKLSISRIEIRYNEIINEANKSLEEAKAQYINLAEEVDKYRNNEAVYEKLAEAAKEIEEGEKKIAELEKPKWYILDRNSNEGFSAFKEDASRMQSLATVFPVIFFLVAALVALTTMTRMVDEERTIIGTYRALGYSNIKIAMKYLSYAASASFLGSVLGVSIGFKLFPTIIWNAYGIVYELPPLKANFYWATADVAVLVSMLCTMVATSIACYSSLKEVPAKLMQPRAPKPGKRVFLEYIDPIWSRLSFIKKVTVRNLFLHKKRFIMTVVGIAGCTALLLTAFGIKDAISALIDDQFKVIFQYNAMIGFEDKKIPQEAQALLNNPEFFTDSIIAMQKTIKATSEKSGEKGAMSVYLLVPEETARLKDFILLRERSSHNDVAFDKQSVIITEKLSEKLKIGIGDTITVKFIDLNNDSDVNLKVTGITENYTFNYIYVAPEIFRNAFGEEPNYNLLLAKVPEDQKIQKQLSEQILKIDGIRTVTFSHNIIDNVKKSLDSVDRIVLVLIISAGMLAFIVLYNLTNINILERKREIATIKVLGFFDGEVNAYIYRETMVLTVIGCIIGLVAGIFLFFRVVLTVEVNNMMLGRRLHAESFIWSTVLTIFFSIIVNIVINHEILKIDMVESLKSAE